MIKKGQKQAVIECVMSTLGPSFIKYKTNALSVLTNSQLENIKNTILQGILNNQIEYSKNTSNVLKVKSYVRSMIMNHLKKAPELNGGINVIIAIKNNRKKINNSITLKKIAPELLTEELREFIKTLI